MAGTEVAAANTNRSLRTIRNELEYLCDLSVITPQQLTSILSQLPPQISLHAPSHVASPSVPVVTTTPTEHYQPQPNPDIKQAYSPTPTPAPIPPPAYPQAFGPPILSTANALYAYTPTDAGDLALQQNDRIQVLEHMNNDWWKGRNERTGLEGIFPRSYVNVVEERRPPMAPIHANAETNYGNMPVTIVPTDMQGRVPSKFEENGKKFGKKIGNAAIFGAGATIGSNIVNGIF